VQIPTSITEYTQTVINAAKKEAKALGMEYEVQIPAAGETSAQTATVEAVIASKPDAIIVEPIDAAGMDAPLAKAKQAGIKVLTYDSNVEDTSVPDAFVATEYLEAGEDIGRTLLRLTHNKGTLLFLSGLPGLEFSEKLENGYKSVVEGVPGINQLPIEYTQFESAKAASIVSAALSRNPELAGGFFGTLPEQKGALTSLNSANDVSKVKSVVFDGNPETIEKLKEGVWDAVVSVPAALYGKKLVQYSHQLLEGESVPKETNLPDCVITKANVNSASVKPCLYEPVEE
jgi:ribose transport system substrate-binding protein